MIVSFRHRFVFVRARKVAGTSVEIALSTLCGPDDISPPIVAIDERLRQDMGGHCGNFSDDPIRERAYLALIRAATPDQLATIPPPPTRYEPHMSLTEIEAAAGRSFADFALVCVERDPFAKIISQLHMNTNFAAYQSATNADMATPPPDAAAVLDRLITRGRPARLKSIHMYGGRPPRVLRYEHLESDLAAFAQTLGVPTPPLPHAKRGPLSNTIDPASLFRRDQIDWINDYFAEEIAAFGYAPR
jgi:hypothetical protein